MINKKEYYQKKYQFKCPICGYPMEKNEYCEECKKENTEKLLIQGEK